jgi:hypothetical protein
MRGYIFADLLGSLTHLLKSRKPLASVALPVMPYSFARNHKRLRTTPVMAAAVTALLWGISDIVNVPEACEAAKWWADSKLSQVNSQALHAMADDQLWA